MEVPAAAIKRPLVAPPSSGKKKKKAKNKHSMLTPTPKKGILKKPSQASPEGFKFTDQPSESVGGLGVVDGPVEDSADAARALFEWMIHPITVQDFYENYWEKKPLLIQREERDYYDGWFSKVEMDRLLREEEMGYGVDLDVTKYVDGKRFTLNPDHGERADPDEVWKFYKDGCSIRFLKPQQHCKRMWQLLSMLESEWGSFCGSNTYLTPAGSQGFSPHYDDIEAFCLQLEGEKHWRVYKPLNAAETLPRLSSRNFDQSEIGEPVVDVVLHTGDLLYFPRGWVHQAVSPPGKDSLHITVSTALHNNWCDLLNYALPRALDEAQEEEVALRASLPRDLLQLAGIVNADVEGGEEALAEARKAFTAEAYRLAKLVLKRLPGVLDTAADQIGRELMHSRLPPVLTERERRGRFGEPGAPEMLGPESKVVLVRREAARLVLEEGQAVVYHSVQNSRVHREKEPTGVIFDTDVAQGVEHILSQYPEPIMVAQIPLADLQDRVDVAQTLYEQGVVLALPDGGKQGGRC